jgi:D-alanine--poly(phosphoribitol) ligase subunit 2
VTWDRDTVKTRIRAKVVELAGHLGIDAGDLGDDDIIPATGVLDSAGVLELVVWYENEFERPLAQDEINIDNLGSINAMADFLVSKKVP